VEISVAHMLLIISLNAQEAMNQVSLEVIMPDSDATVLILAFAVLLFLWQPIVFLSIIGAYVAAYVFYWVALIAIPQHL